MTLKKEEEERLLDSAVEVIKGLGGVKGVRDGLAEMHAAWKRMERETETLLKTYPDKWVAMSKDGVVAVEDSLEDVFVKVDASGLRRNAVEVRFMDTDPKMLIL